MICCFKFIFSVIGLIMNQDTKNFITHMKVWMQVILKQMQVKLETVQRIVFGNEYNLYSDWSEYNLDWTLQ